MTFLFYFASIEINHRNHDPFYVVTATMYFSAAIIAFFTASMASTTSEGLSVEDVNEAVGDGIVPLRLILVAREAYVIFAKDLV